MEQLTIVEHGPFLTTLLTSNAHNALYSVESRRHSEGWWSSAISCTEPEDGSRMELAKVTYFNPGTTRVTFGTQEVGIDAFLRRRSTSSNSRIFVGPNGETYKWRINGHNLELYNVSSRTLLARSRSSRVSLLTRKVRPASLELSRKGFDPETLDAVVVTFVIMDHLLRDRLKYGHPR